MNGEKRTSGPWWRHPSFPATVLAGPESNSIIVFDNFGGDDTAKANAEFAVLAENNIGDLIAALRLMLSDYRTEGCPDPACRICTKSKGAETAAREALAKWGAP
jgi:hypothetical protein